MPDVPSEGGRNYLRGTSDEYQTYTSNNYVLGFASTYRDWLKLLGPLRGKTVTIRSYIKNDTDYPVRIQVWANNGGVNGNTVAPHSEGWSVKTGKMSADWTSANVALTQEPSTAPGGTIHVKKAKVEISETATPYSQAPEDFGWSATTLVPTQSNRYLWKFEYIYYSDGSVEVTRPVNISIAGADGTNGQTSHVHFAFADNATGGGFSLTTPKAYMGWYADFNETASNDPTKYKWGKWKGDQGLPGKPGADGNTSYLHLAFASSADGKTGFSFTESGQQYQGYYTDFTQTSSTDYRKYKWVDRFANVQIGGRNLLTGTRYWSSNIQRWSSNYNGVWHDETEEYNNLKVKSTTGGYNGWHQNVFVKSGEYYTLSYYAKADTNINVKSSLTWDKSPIFKGPVANFDGSNNISDNITTEWKRYSRTVKITGDGSLQWRIEYDGVALPSGKWYIAGMKLERGTVATDWSPAPEDTQAQIDSKADSALTQEQLNALAEKNRTLEAELEAKAALATVEAWKEAYDNYVAQNEVDKAVSEANLVTATNRITALAEDWQDKKVSWSFLDTHMDFQNEGLILGKKGSPTTIRISNDRIAFYSGGTEVASMSEGTLTIDNGIFAKSLQIGHFREEVYEGDNNINVIRWVD